MLNLIMFRAQARNHPVDQLVFTFYRSEIPFSFQAAINAQRFESLRSNFQITPFFQSAQKNAVQTVLIKFEKSGPFFAKKSIYLFDAMLSWIDIYVGKYHTMCGSVKNLPLPTS
jgi:hypothetical protein